MDLICCQTFSHEIDRFPSTVHRDSAAHQGEEVKTNWEFLDALASLYFKLSLGQSVSQRLMFFGFPVNQVVQGIQVIQVIKVIQVIQVINEFYVKYTYYP